MPTESCREANDGSLVWEFVYDEAIGVFYVIMEFGQYTAIPMEIKPERVYLFGGTMAMYTYEGAAAW